MQQVALEVTKVGQCDLTWWYFLMATVHGAGLMIAPLVLSMTMPAAGPHVAHQAAMQPGTGIFLGVLIHTLAMLVVMALVAWIVYKKVGLRILRSHWINFDRIGRPRSCWLGHSPCWKAWASCNQKLMAFVGAQG